MATALLTVTRIPSNFILFIGTFTWSHIIKRIFAALNNKVV